MPEKTVLFHTSFIEVLSGTEFSSPHGNDHQQCVILPLRDAQFHTLRSALQKCSVLSVVPGAGESCT